jgi:hypothetical protein
VKVDPTVPQVGFEYTQHGKTVILAVKLNSPSLGWIIRALGPYYHRIRGDVEVTMARPRQQDLAAVINAFRDDTRNNAQLPRGTFEPPPDPSRYRPLPPDQRISWMANLLPYLGHADEYRTMDFKKGWRDPANRWAATTLVPQFLDGRSPRDNWRAQYPGLPSVKDLAATHYVGIAGVGLDAAAYQEGDPATAKKLGMFGYDRLTRLDQVMDGLSNTVLLAQVPWDKGQFPLTTHQRPWIAGGGSTVQGVPEKRSVQPFVSTQHDGKKGTYVLMVDGSVRFVSEKISDDVFKAMCTVNGAEKVALDRDAPLIAPAGAELVAKPGVPPAPAAGDKPAANVPAPK